MEMATSLSYKSTSMLVWCLSTNNHNVVINQPTNTSHLAGTTKTPHRYDVQVMVLIQ